jgi:ADP-ribose pyrophosphatase YjhB (NUDIX family)
MTSSATREKLTHAGGVVMRVADGAVQVLLVRARPKPHDWVLPKGHIDPGETPETTARREVREETGVRADIVEPIGDDRFVARDKHVYVRYYLMKSRRIGAGEEDREIRWCRAAEVEALLEFESSRQIVRNAFERFSR